MSKTGKSRLSGQNTGFRGNNLRHCNFFNFGQEGQNRLIGGDTLF